MAISKDIPTKFSSASEPVFAKYHEITLATWNKRSHSVVVEVEGFASAPSEGEVLESMISHRFDFPVPVGASLSSAGLDQLLLSTPVFSGGEIF